MIGHPGVAAQFFAALAAEGINIEMIATSEIKVSCIVPKQDAHRALQVTHSAFGLGGETTFNRHSALLIVIWKKGVRSQESPSQELVINT